MKYYTKIILLLALAFSAQGAYAEFVSQDIPNDLGNSRSAIMGDVNNDGNLDIYVGARLEQNKLWIGNRDGTFTNSDILGDDQGNTTDAAMADLNGDGNLDIYVTNSFSKNKLWLGNGDGTFTNADIPADSTTSRSSSVVIGDVDNDGDLDIYVGAFSGGTNVLWINDGTGNFIDGSISGDGIADDVAMADFNNDGNLDIYASRAAYNNQNKLWLGNGDGTFVSGNITGDICTDQNNGCPGRSVVVGDIDGDNDIDLYLTSYYDDQPVNLNRFWINNNDGTFASQNIANDYGGTAQDSEIVDFDGDGDLDILIAMYFGFQNIIWENDGSGNFTQNNITGDTGESFGVTTGDVNNDGEIDVYVVNGDNGDFQNRLWLQDTTPPVITLTGSDPVTVPVNTPYSDAGAAATDNLDGDITVNIVTVNPVDTSTLGSYTITYNVADAAGNDAIEVTRIVNVVTSFTQSSNTSTASENAGTASYTIVLDAEPTSDVVIDLSSSDTNEATVSPSSLTFTPANWDTPQTVTVTGVDDDLVQTDTASITASINAAASADEYDAVADQAHIVTLTDDDAASIIIDPSGITTTGLTILENAGTGSFNVRLGSQPLTDVVIDLSSSDTGEATVSPSSLTFTTGNWNVNQTITVTAVNDDLDRDDSATLTISVNDAASDDTYDGVADATASIIITDDDMADFTQSSNTSTASENAGTASYTIVLDAEPTSDVVIDLSSSDTNEATVSPSSLTFTPANWDTPQTVTVTGVDDDLVQTDTASITASINAAASADEYDAVADQAHIVTLTDDDATTSTSKGSSRRVSKEKLAEIFGTPVSEELGKGEQCPSSQILNQNMKVGDRNGSFSSWENETITEVKILQAHMNRLGFASGKVDGILGPITDGAIKRMQAYLGTTQDGYVGPITRSLINNSCGKEVIEVESTPVVEDAKCFINYRRLIKRGMTGNDIRQAQECIASLGHSIGPFDGIYGGLTYAGIRSYQQANNLILDGIIGPETAGHLNALSGVALDGVTSLN